MQYLKKSFQVPIRNDRYDFIDWGHGPKIPRCERHPEYDGSKYPPRTNGAPCMTCLKVHQAVHKDDVCPTCGGEKLIGSGGQDQDGRWLNIPCPTCNPRPSGEKKVTK